MTGDAEKITYRWRAVAPDGGSRIQPTWSSDLFTEAQVRENLARYYGTDWTLEVQTTTVSTWKPLG